MNSSQIEVESHKPVLINSLIKHMPKVSGVWVDCTFGAGGYSKALLEAGAERIIGIDRDPNVASHAVQLKALYGPKIELCQAKFSSLKEVLDQFKFNKIAGIVFDIGLSSMQIDTPDRGFSFQQDGPLDMRMSQKGVTAADIVNNASEEELANIIYYYGEDRYARVIARAIINERAKKEIVRTEHLSCIIKSAVKQPNFKGNKNLNVSTRTFQALRIAVNDELEELNLGLRAAEKILDEGSVLAVVSFHSLEDRIVKQFIKLRSKRSSGQSRYLPEKKITSPTFRELCNKVLKPTSAEITSNPRAKSAKLRIAVKLSSRNYKEEWSELNFPKVKFFTGFG